MDRLRNFGFLLKDVSRLSSRNFERHAAEVKLGLTLEQCKVLVVLQRNQGINQKRLAELTDTDQMTLVRILDRMEQDEWIERRPDPQDRRAWRLHLKPAAAPILKRILTIADHARSELLAGLDAAERETLISLLERIHANLLALVPGAVDRYQASLGDEGGVEADEIPLADSNKRSRARSRAKDLKAMQ
jgi:MarR family transcriptional regulator, transcriptional regulator for hemolysin